jgi:fumarylacetoacetate (FAA) hydrolase
MRLVSFTPKGAGGRALGLLDGERVLDLGSAVDGPGVGAKRLDTMETLLADWDAGLAAAREAVTRGDLTARARSEVSLLPPVARPPTIRDFYAFEAHVRNARARRGLTVPPEWYEFPVFYFSNPGALAGPEEPIRRPGWTQALDFELEIACVIGKRSRDVPAERWRDVVAGFTILNDWSARDVQRREMAVGLGPAKGKDFATSLGPALVTVDELESRRQGDHFDLAMEARVNGKTLSRGNARDMHWTFGQMIARASQDVYLFPGDVIGSGTMGGGCLLELGPDVHRWLEPGDEVTLEVEVLGALTNRIA